MHYGFQHILKFSFQHALQISEHSEISRHAENHVKHFKECWNIVFKMHYRFQHVLKFSFQHALQISEHSELFKCFFKMFSTHFKHKNSPMVWTMLKTVLRTMSNISKCWKPYWKFQGLGRTAEKGMTWPLRDLLKTYFTELIQLKYKLILWIKTMGCCGLACVVWLKSCELLKRKSVLIVGNSSIMCLLRKFLNLTYL